MSKRSKRRVEIERLFALREAEGMSLRTLSERSGIPVGTLSWWASRLRRAAPAAFAEVAVTDVPTAGPWSEADRPLLRLRLPSGLVAELDGDLAERVAMSLLEGELRC